MEDPKFKELRYELNEAKAEIDRHHDDFEKISVLAEELYQQVDQLSWVVNQNLDYIIDNIRAIRNVVG